MSAPKIIVQIVITGTQIFGKALYAGVQQAVKNAKAAPAALGADVAGVDNARSGSMTDKLTRDHRLTLDEAHLILNVTREDSLEHILQRYEHLFKVNAPSEAPATPAAAPKRRAKAVFKYHSHYLQSKVVRARERIEAEHKIEEAPPPPPSSESTPPPPSIT